MTLNCDIILYTKNVVESELLYEKNHLDTAVYVGDIQGDYDATMQAGLPFIHAAYGFGQIDHPVEKIDALTDLPEVMKKIG